MARMVRMSLDAPEETRPFEAGMGQLELVNLASGAVGRATFQPGWQWSKHVKPIAKTDSCQAAHTGYFVSGRMKVVMDDGEEAEFGPGDVMICPPGHDAWIVGDEPCVVIDWQGFALTCGPDGFDYSERRNEMTFVQIIEFRSSQFDAMRKVADEWEAATEGKRKTVRRVLCRDRDDAGRIFIIAFFDSYAAAMENSALPETDALSGKMMGLADGPPTFYNLDVEEDKAG